MPCELFFQDYIILQIARRKKWDPQKMEEAIEALRNKEMSSHIASRVLNLSQTPERYVKDRQKSSSEVITTKLNRKQVLPCEAENDLAEHCLLLEKNVYWLVSGRRIASRLPNCCKERN